MEAGLGYVGDPREHVGEPDERIDIVEPARGDEGVHHRGAFAAPVRTYASDSGRIVGLM